MKNAGGFVLRVHCPSFDLETKVGYVPPTRLVRFAKYSGADGKEVDLLRNEGQYWIRCTD